MKRFDILFYIAISLGLLTLAAGARASDLVCTSTEPAKTQFVVSTTYRDYKQVIVNEAGLERTLRIKDTLQPSEIDDYVSYFDGKYKVSYSLECERL
jgi:predicted membrane-bound spermidine synthase